MLPMPGMNVLTTEPVASIAASASGLATRFVTSTCTMFGKIAPAYGQAVCYAKDAMTGLSLMNRIMDPAARAAVLEAHQPVVGVAPEAPVERAGAPAGTRGKEKRKKQS